MEHAQPRRLASKRDILPLCALLLFAALFLLLLSRAPQGKTVVIQIDGEVAEVVELSTLQEPVERDLIGAGGITVTLLLEPEGASFLRSGCPDKTCVHTGKITRAGESALCLPARISLKLEGENGFDGVTY